MLNRKLGFQEYLFIGCWRIQLNWNTLCVAFIIIMTDFNEFTLDLTQYNRNKIKLLIFLLCIQICPSPLNVLNNVFFSYYFILGKKNKNFEPRKTSSSINTRTNKAWLPTLSCLLDVWVWYRAENVNYFFFSPLRFLNWYLIWFTASPSALWTLSSSSCSVEMELCFIFWSFLFSKTIKS